MCVLKNVKKRSSLPYVLHRCSADIYYKCMSLDIFELKTHD